MGNALGSQNIFLIGPMGAGKTTIGRYLARWLGRDFYDTDIQIEQRAGANLGWIFDIEGEEGFRERETKIIEELSVLQGIVLATGGGAILEPRNRQMLGARGVVIYLKVSVDEQMERTTRDERRPTLRTGDKREVLEKMYAEYTKLYEEIADFSFATHGQSVKVIAKKIFDDLCDRFDSPLQAS